MPRATVRHLGMVELYLEFDELPDACRPVWVVQEDGATLVTVDPRSTNLEATRALVETLTDREANAIRWAYDTAPVGNPCPEEWLNCERVDTYVPPMLRLRSSDVLQRGA